MNDEPIRGHIRSQRFRRVSHGLFLEISAHPDQQTEWLRDLRAWLEVLPSGAVLTGLTAAKLADWHVPVLPEWLPVFASVEAGQPRPQRAGLVVSRFIREADHEAWVLRGFPVDSPFEVLLRCARDLALLDLVPLVESAIRSGAVTGEAITEGCRRPRPGVRVLRRALELADPCSESGWETMLRILLVSLGVEVEVQPEIRDGRGNLVARADLRVRGTNQLFEYDGATHRTASSQLSDLRRDRRIVDAGQVRRGYTAADILGHPTVVMAEVDRCLDRPSLSSRLSQWRRLIANSSHSRAGVDRLRTRWAVAMRAFNVGNLQP